MSIAAGFRDKWAVIATAARVTGSDTLFAEMQKAADDAGLRLSSKSEFVALANTITALRSRVERMESALRDCEEFFNERADADLPHGCDSPIPNDDMKMLAFVREALAGKATCA